MSAIVAIVLVALIVAAVVTWSVLWGRDEAQQEQLDALADRLTAVELAQHLDAAERARLEDRRP